MASTIFLVSSIMKFSSSVLESSFFNSRVVALLAEMSYRSDIEVLISLIVLGLTSLIE